MPTRCAARRVCKSAALLRRRAQRGQNEGRAAPRTAVGYAFSVFDSATLSAKHARLLCATEMLLLLLLLLLRRTLSLSKDLCTAVHFTLHFSHTE